MMDENKTSPRDIVAPTSHSELNELFRRLNYDWNALSMGVPPLVVERFPDDYYNLNAGEERKRIFFLSLLPMVLLVNDEILSQRDKLRLLCEQSDRNEPLTDGELEFIIELADQYKVEGNPLVDPIARSLILNRIDILPPSLVLAQAASESAYGTSRFARLGNNIFGEMVFDGSQGIIPRHNPADGMPPYKARKFPTLLASLRAYMINLNTHPAYLDLRIRRAGLRARGSVIRGRELADGLLAYSERGDAYIKDIKTLIAVNRLSLLADVSLRQPPPLTTCQAHSSSTLAEYFPDPE